MLDLALRPHQPGNRPQVFHCNRLSVLPLRLNSVAPNSNALNRNVLNKIVLFRNVPNANRKLMLPHEVELRRLSLPPQPLSRLLLRPEISPIGPLKHPSRGPLASNQLNVQPAQLRSVLSVPKETPNLPLDSHPDSLADFLLSTSRDACQSRMPRAKDSWSLL